MGTEERNEQVSMSMTGYFDKGKKTRRERFLAEMAQVVPWARLSPDRAAVTEVSSTAVARPAAGSYVAHLLPAQW